MLGMPNGQMAPDMSNFGAAGFFPGMGGQPAMGYQNMGQSDFTPSQNTDGLPQSFPRRPSEEEERLRQQLAAYARLMDDWIQFTEEKWRTVSDSQLGWKPLRGRWANWDDIFQDAYAAKTSDPMAQAAQSAGEATSRRYESSKEKGSAASAVACFMRDMMTLRRGLDLLRQGGESLSGTESDMQPVIEPLTRRFGGSGLLRNAGMGNSMGGSSSRNSLIRRPIFVDADTDK